MLWFNLAAILFRLVPPLNTVICRNGDDNIWYFKSFTRELCELHHCSKFALCTVLYSPADT